MKKKMLMTAVVIMIGSCIMAQNTSRTQTQAQKMQRKEQRKQEAAQNREMYMEKEQTTTRNKGARNATPQRNAVKVSRSTGPGRK